MTQILTHHRSPLWMMKMMGGSRKKRKKREKLREKRRVTTEAQKWVKVILQKIIIQAADIVCAQVLIYISSFHKGQSIYLYICFQNGSTYQDHICLSVCGSDWSQGEHKSIARLKRFISLCGVRRNYKKLLEGCRSVRSQVAVLKKELEDLGLEGRSAFIKLAVSMQHR